MVFRFDIATASSADSARWKPGTWDWDRFVKRCKAVHRTHETVKEYAAMNRTQQSKIKDIGGFFGGLLSGVKRSRESVIHRQLICLDADYADPQLWADWQMIYGHSAVIYSTHKHTPEQPRYRLCIPVDRPLDSNEYEPVARRIAETLGIEQFDVTTYAIERLMFWPSASADGAFFAADLDTDLLRVDEVLASYRDWRDVSQWPIGSRETTAVLRDLKKQQDPLEKEGIVGAFCRTYTMTECLTQILPDYYEPCDVEDRYTYRNGTTAAGLIVYEDKYAFSHHGTDPASGKLCNAFDLVRLHKFGTLDETSPASTPTHKLPSQIAMETFASKDKEVAAMIAEERFRQAGEDFAEALDETGEEANTDWVKKLEVDRRGDFVTNVENIELILLNDPHLRGQFGMNTFAYRFEVLGKLPWNPAASRRLWSDDDWSGLRAYMQKEPYRLERSPKLDDAMGAIKPIIGFNPVKDYLKAQRWDRKPRIERLFIDYQGAEDTLYVRTVTRKMLIAAVARVFDPGCKFDYVLTLVGPEGKGKSEMLKRLGGDWFTDTFSFHMLSGGNGKQAIEAIQGMWIVEIAEMAGLRKAEVEAAKGFIASREDYFRPSHARESVSRKRQCIFIGTSNNFAFLQSANGNRRFWPVEIFMQDPLKDVWEDLTPDEVGQIWAEAKHYYNSMESLYIGEEVEEMARQKQQLHEEKDDRREAILRYLNILLPADWELLTPYERRNYIESANEADARPGTIVRNRVSAAEVWQECMGGELKNMNPQNTRPIHNILRSLDGWEPMHSKTDIKNYGTQRAYRRKMAFETA